MRELSWAGTGAYCLRRRESNDSRVLSSRRAPDSGCLSRLSCQRSFESQYPPLIPFAGRRGLYELPFDSSVSGAEIFAGGQAERSVLFLPPARAGAILHAV